MTKVILALVASAFLVQSAFAADPPKKEEKTPAKAEIRKNEPTKKEEKE